MNVGADAAIKTLDVRKSNPQKASFLPIKEPKAFAKNVEQNSPGPVQNGSQKEKKAEAISTEKNQDPFIKTDEDVEEINPAVEVSEIQALTDESMIAAIATPIASLPVLKVLSTELSAEDLKMYSEFMEQEPVILTSPVIPSLMVQAAPIEEEMPKPLGGVAEFLVTEKPSTSIPENEAVQLATVIYKPGDQAVTKPENVSKFTQMVQLVNQALESETNEPVLVEQKESSPSDIESESLPKDVKKSEKNQAPLFSVEENKLVKKEPLVAEEGSKGRSIKIEPQDSIPQVTQVKDMPSPKVVQQPMTQAQVMTRAPQIVQDVAVHMKQAIDLGMDKITIQVNPPSLGKIEVELRFSQDGRVNAILMADKVETYDLLKQSPQLLKEALSGAGVNADSTDVSFSLRGENDSHERNANHRQSKANGALGKIVDMDETIAYRQAPNSNTTKKVDINA